MTEDPYVIDWDDAAPRLAVAADADAAWYASAAAFLVRPGDRVAIDVGCGGAGMAVALGRTLDDGQVVAVDGDATVLASAESRLREAGLGAGIAVDVVLADLDGGLEPVRAALSGAADVVWASASVHHAGDQQAAVDKLASLVGAGGRLALAEGGLPIRCLPWDVGVGEPGLEGRLDAAQDRWLAGMRQRLPGATRMPYGWGEALGRAGLRYAGARTWLMEKPTPLSAADRDRVVDELAHRVSRARAAGLLDEADLATWDQLLDETGRHSLRARTDLQRVTARTVHVGIRDRPVTTAATSGAPVAG